VNDFMSLFIAHEFGKAVFGSIQGCEKIIEDYSYPPITAISCLSVSYRYL